MRKKFYQAVLASAAFVGTVAMVAAQDSAQPFNNPVPMQTSINRIMVMAVDYAAHWIWDAREDPPATDEDWFRIEVHATQLVVLGSAIALGGTGAKDNDWAKWPRWAESSQVLVDAAQDALKAVEARNVEALNAAGDRLVDSCTACHDVFKPDVPTEGLLHRDVHREGREHN